MVLVHRIEPGGIGPDVQPRAVALGLWVLLEGLIRNWLIGPDFDLVTMGTEIVGTHLDGLRARGSAHAGNDLLELS